MRKRINKVCNVFNAKGRAGSATNAWYARAANAISTIRSMVGVATPTGPAIKEAGTSEILKGHNGATVIHAAKARLASTRARSGTFMRSYSSPAACTVFHVLSVAVVVLPKVHGTTLRSDARSARIERWQVILPGEQKTTSVRIRCTLTRTFEYRLLLLWDLSIKC